MAAVSSMVRPVAAGDMDRPLAYFEAVMWQRSFGRNVDKGGDRSHFRFSAMRMANPLSILVRVIFLVVMGFVLAPGAAMAHGESTMASDLSPRRLEVQAAHHMDVARTIESPTFIVAAERNNRDVGSCADPPSGYHVAGACCSIACHAALAAAFEGPGSCEVGKFRMAKPADMLVGRPSDGAERPPKHS